MTTIPIDILAHIVEFIDHPKDLLSLALTARALHAIIIPRHIDYRRISCAAASEHIWKHLLDTPYDACSRIRYLNILRSHGPTQVPRMCRSKLNSGLPPLFWRSDNDLLNDISDILIQALSKMANLKVLRFETSSQNDNVVCLISEAIGESGCSLEELEVHFGLSNTTIKEHFKKDKLSRNLEKFSLFYDHLPSLRKYVIRNGYQFDGSVVLQMFPNAPNLTHMNVAWGLSPAFLSGYWPNLQHLQLSSVDVPTEKGYPSSLRIFFSRHSKLITLSTANILLPGWAIESDDFLPDLKSLYVESDLHPPAITNNIGARLTHLTMNTAMYRCLLECGIILSSLESCAFCKASIKVPIQGLVDMAPNIQKLYITFEPNYCLDAPVNLNEIIKRVRLFAGFKNLRILLGIFDYISVDGNLLFEALYDFPKLLYTRIRLKNDNLKTFRLERDDVAKVMRYEYEEVVPSECHFARGNQFSIYRHGNREDWHLSRGMIARSSQRYV